MKKKILLVVMVSVLFAGVVSAASIWGTYKGNQIIRITSNGVALKSPDVPAISYNGRTMIPLNMLGQLGIGYTWDSKNQTIDVKLSSSNNSNNSNLNSIKNNVSYANYFHDLETLGDMVTGLATTYSTAFTYVSSNFKQTSEVLIDANKTLNGIIDTYNQINNQSGYFVDSNIKNVLDGYHEALSLYKEADTAINEYYVSKSSQSFSTYLSSTQKASKVSGTARFLASTRYTFYINSALNSK